ncbi:uncharacterized protein LOC132280842 [Cornus florida]|uniref:uncharacterized protein LOC132280842 n=1 Tax=Cornus florida TaxID=4283 RepID=UPI0028966F99|nr:uncharacterized protein LOC132280842 [Cornus florida]
MQCSSVLSHSPSFNTYSSRKFAEFRAKSESEVDECQESKKEEDDFEFTFVCRKFDSSPADEIFSNGQIRPIFPIFNRDNSLYHPLLGDVDNGNSGNSKPPTRSTRFPLRKLLTDEHDSSSCSSSEADELDGAPPGTYCVWTPKVAAGAEGSPERWKKSSSMGTLKRWKFRDLLRRSNSDGKNAFVFLTTSNVNVNGSEKKRDEKIVEKGAREAYSKFAGKVTAKRVAGGKGGLVAAAHEAHYTKKGAVKEADRRRSFLPYREDLVGFFANVNGLSRNLHPF